MKTGFLMAAALLLGAPAAASAADAATQDGYSPIRPISKCLDPSRARSWTMLDSSRLLVDAGRNKYLFEMAWTCPELATQPALKFTSRSTGGRVCGAVGERVRAGGLPGKSLLPPPGQEDGCLISRASVLTADEYAAELRAASGSSATVRGSLNSGG